MYESTTQESQVDSRTMACPRVVCVSSMVCSTWQHRELVPVRRVLYPQWWVPATSRTVAYVWAVGTASESTVFRGAKRSGWGQAGNPWARGPLQATKGAWPVGNAGGTGGQRWSGLHA